MGSWGSHEGFGKAKCKVLHLGWGKPQYQYTLGVEGIESSSAEKNFGELVDERLEKEGGKGALPAWLRWDAAPGTEVCVLWG